MKTQRAEAPWPADVWAGIDQAVADECRRIKVADKLLPRYCPAGEARTVPSERIERAEERFSIDEAPVTPLAEIWVELALTRQQVAREAELGTARTLARRAANLLAQAEDALIFQGAAAFEGEALFSEQRALHRSGPVAAGLLSAFASEEQVLEVPALDADELDTPTPRFGERTFEAVAQAYVRLQENEHQGPYALVLPPGPFADTHAALPRTLLRPAERIEQLLASRVHGSSTLPPLTGLLMSVGGSALELVVGREPAVSFMFEDAAGKYRFRVWERFALRVRDETAIVRLDFQAR